MCVGTLSAKLMIADVVGFRENSDRRLVPEAELPYLGEHLLTSMENTTPETLAKERDLMRLLRLAPQTDAARGEKLVAPFAENDKVWASPVRRTL